MNASATETVERRESVWGQCVEFWRRMPDKALFFIIFAAWLALFHFFGNSTLGYTGTHSLFGWMANSYQGKDEDGIGWVVPIVVLGLVYWKRKALMDLPKRQWWPGIILLAVALSMHLLGYFVQQTRISVVAFFAGLYFITGLVWGPQWLRAIFFPFVLFAFCLPLSSEADTITMPMRLLATRITGVVCSGLGVNLIQHGTQIYDSSGSFQYEVAAACSGIRSLTATLALSVVYAFMYFRGTGRRLLIIGSAFPLAILGNVFRLTLIVVAAEAFGQSAGDYVHSSSWLSLLPYVPVFAGLLAVGRLLREADVGPKATGEGLQQPA